MRKRRTREHVIADLSVSHVPRKPLGAQDSMVARSSVNFERLEQLLLDLGFTQTKRGDFWVFVHDHSKAILTYRPYRSRERVTRKDLQVTRQDLEWHELMTPEAFDDALQKATA
jgi:hypothetical protein